MKENQFTKGDAFTKPWYTNDRKYLKQKLGSLFQCKLKGSDESQQDLCRVMNYDRISSYPIETFFTELARI